LDSDAKGLLKSHSRSVAHMRAQVDKGRFGLVLGAGVSKPLGFPSWSELVQRIADDGEVKGGHILASAGGKLPETSKTQMLFQHYRSKILEATTEALTAKIERRIQGQWRRIIHRALYKEVAVKPEDLRDKHPYLREFIPVIKKAGMTINYNFDDTIQQLILLDYPQEDGNSVRPFETVWNAYLPFRSDSAIIYHPNGFLPRNLLEYPSENLVLSEDSFADQLIESMAGHHASLLHHLSKTTCLFIGLSLQDATLRHLLRQSALINSGHYHYYVNFIRSSDPRDSAAEQALREANFEVYNLITLFLGDKELAALGRLFTAPESALRKEAEELGVDLKYFYYLTGAVGAGKTTCLNYLGSLRTYEEWTEARPIELGKSWKDLNPAERDKLDEWIARQFDLRNCVLIDQKIGIHVCDRSPLDPISFTDDKQMPAKAEFILKHLSPGKAMRRAQNGQIIFLTGKPEDLEARVVGRHKYSGADLIADMQTKLGRIFKDPTFNIDTTGLSISQVIKRVARIIFLSEYKPVDLGERLIEIEKNGV
jgi:hypothetical protein